MTAQIAIIRNRRQITLPKTLTRQFDLGVGDKLIMRWNSTQIRLEPVKTTTIDLLSKIQTIVKEVNISEKELQNSATGIRKEMAKKYTQ